MNKDKYYWLNDDSRQFLARGYLAEGQTAEERIKQIADHAEELTNINGFSAKFQDYMSRGWFSLSSPVWSNYGTDRGFPVSCFGSYIDDSMESILATHSEVGMLSKFGGGTSGYFGNIRPRGAEIDKKGQSSGSVHFMELFDKLTNVVSQGCYAEGTEILTESGWVPFNELPKGVKVAQVGDNDTVTFVTPLDYMEFEVDEKLLSFKDARNIDLLVTKNHNMEYKYEAKQFSTDRKTYSRIVKPEYRVAPAANVPTHRDVKFVHSSFAPKGRGLSDMERFLIAFQADGTQVCGNSETAIRFRFSKERKATRLRSILDILGFSYTESFHQSDMTYNFYLNLYKMLPKLFNEWVNLSEISLEWAIDFLGELSNWDGSVCNDGAFTYCSIYKSNVDIAQAVAALCGQKSYSKVSLREEEPNKQPLYTIYFSNSQYFGVEKLVPEEVSYKGKVYCVEVPSHRLLIRSNGRTLVCGNSVRRGFFSAYLPIDHADFDEFVGIGKEGHSIQNLTHGVTVSDAFMQKMIDGDEEARRRWAKVIQMRSEVGYPYIFWSDTVNKNKPSCFEGRTIWASNMCSEIALPSNKDETFVCVLSSMNLLHYDDWKDTDAVETLTIFLDSVCTEFINRAEEMRKEKPQAIAMIDKALNFCKRWRALGLGVLGFHSYLHSKMIPFESREAAKWNLEMIKLIRQKAEHATLGKNATLLAIAPTKSSSFILGGVSQGVEPEWSNYYIKDLAKTKVTQVNQYLEELITSKYSPSEKFPQIEDVWASIKAMDGSVQHLDFLSEKERDVFKTFIEINPETIISYAAARQPYIDQSQSINLMIDPAMPTRDINKLYISAWQQGLKTLYYQYSLNAAQSAKREKYMKQGCAACEA